ERSFGRSVVQSSPSLVVVSVSINCNGVLLLRVPDPSQDPNTQRNRSRTTSIECANSTVTTVSGESTGNRQRRRSYRSSERGATGGRFGNRRPRKTTVNSVSRWITLLFCIVFVDRGTNRADRSTAS